MILQTARHDSAVWKLRKSMRCAALSLRNAAWRRISSDTLPYPSWYRSIPTHIA